MRIMLGAILIIAASFTALGQISDRKANHFIQKDDAVAKAVMQLEEELRLAVLKRDTKAYARIVADDYLFTNQDAAVRTKAEMLTAYNSESIVYDSLVFDEIKVRAYGDTAVVTGRSTSKGVDKGKDISGVYRYTRVYVKRQSRWQLVATQVTRIP